MAKLTKKAKKVQRRTMEEVPGAEIHVLAGRDEGKAARKLVPRSSLADLPLPPDRSDPVAQLTSPSKEKGAPSAPQ